MLSMISWKMFEPKMPLQLVQVVSPKLNHNEVLVKVSGCGVCHTDLGFYYDGVKTKSSLPLTLGHEVSGIIIEVGRDAKKWLNKAVVIPAVIPCGICDLCIKGMGNICRSQKMLGNDIDGGFASHLVVSSEHLCNIPIDENFKPIGKEDLSIADLSVVADAISTPYQAIVDSGLNKNHVAIFVGVGGVGGFGVQIAKALGSFVVAIDIEESKLESISPYADLVLNSKKLSFKDLRKYLYTFLESKGRSMIESRIFETSGTSSGQKTAFGLLTFGSHLSVVGFTMDIINIRLSNLMAFHVTARGNWGCLTEYYPKILDLVLSGKINIKNFVKFFPLDEINSVFQLVHEKNNNYRPILIP